MRTRSACHDGRAATPTILLLDETYGDRGLEIVGVAVQETTVDNVKEYAERYELGYRIDKREYALPEISFEPDEVAALSLAARTWTRASLAGPAATALRKLRAAGVTMRQHAS